MTVGAKPRKKFDIIRIDAPLSRQPLVKGERLVRFEVSAAMPDHPHPPSPTRSFASYPAYTLHQRLAMPKNQIQPPIF